MSSNGPPPGRWYGTPTTEPPTSPPPPPPKATVFERVERNKAECCDSGLGWLALAWLILGGE